MATKRTRTDTTRPKPRKGRAAIDRNAQVVRVLQILRELDRLGGVDLYELSQRYGTTTRTIRRDFAALEEAGVPLVEESSEGRKKRWRVDYKGQQRKLAELLDASHYLALRLAMDQAGATRRSSAMFATLEDLSDKIESALGAKGRKHIEAINGCFYSYEKFAYQSSPPDVFWPLISAIAERQLCVLKYRAPRAEPQDAKFRALPLKLFAHGGAIYLHAFVPKHENVIVLNLQRLQALEVLDERATPPPDYKPEQWEASAFGIFVSKNPVRYKLRFVSDAAPYIRERIWHPTQKLRELSRGALELTFTCSESYEVAAWVASWRTAVEVIEPESLRREMAEFGKWSRREVRLTSPPAFRRTLPAPHLSRTRARAPRPIGHHRRADPQYVPWSTITDGLPSNSASMRAYPSPPLCSTTSATRVSIADHDANERRFIDVDLGSSGDSRSRREPRR